MALPSSSPSPTPISTITEKLPTKSFLILYCSITGNSIDLSERIAKRCRKQHWSVKVKSVAQFDREDLLEIPLILFVLPTAGNGTAPSEFTSLWNDLLSSDLPHDILSDLRFAVFALGDSSYPKYNWAGRKLFRRLEGLGATAIVERGEADDQNEWGIESTFPTWLTKFVSAINSIAPLPINEVDIKRLSIEEEDNSIPPARIQLNPIASTSTLPYTKDVKWSEDVRTATIKLNQRVTTEDWFQDVRKIELEFEDGDLSYEAGAVLEIKPQNSPAQVDQFLTSIGWTSIADIPYSITSTSSDQPLPPHLPSTSYQTTIRDLLTFEFDLGSVPRLSFFEWLSSFCTRDLDLKEKLEWFCTGEGQDDLNDYTHLPRRTLLEVIFEFRSGILVPPEYIFDLLPPLRSRGFSIASSGKIHRQEVHLLVAVVRYRTKLSEERKGVCTSWLKNLKQGDKLQVRFEKGILKLPPLVEVPVASSLPLYTSPPLILIGPGTGVAPFRSILEERIQLQNSKENLLFFGCRKVEKDYYFRNDWEEMVSRGNLKLFVAASRDQDDKIYVQHRIAEQAVLIWDYLTRGGYLYICGSSTQMPKSVKKALLVIFEQQGGLSGLEGEKKWDQLEKEGRILEETWG